MLIIRENEMAGFIIGYQTKSSGYVKLQGQSTEYWDGPGPVVFSGTIDEFAVAYPLVVEEMVQGGILHHA